MRGSQLAARRRAADRLPDQPDQRRPEEHRRPEEQRRSEEHRRPEEQRRPEERHRSGEHLKHKEQAEHHYLNFNPRDPFGTMRAG
jgi:hypothetical protein